MCVSKCASVSDKQARVDEGVETQLRRTSEERRSEERRGSGPEAVADDTGGGRSFGAFRAEGTLPGRRCPWRGGGETTRWTRRREGQQATGDRY